MVAAFINDEQRGVGLTNLVPFGPFAGTYQFQMMIYSNVAEGEILTFNITILDRNNLYFK